MSGDDAAVDVYTPPAGYGNSGAYIPETQPSTNGPTPDHSRARAPSRGRVRPVPALVAVPVEAHERTDLGNAELFVSLHGERFRHVKERHAWLVWDRGRWRRDETGEAERAAKETARELLRRAADIADLGEQKRAAGWAHKSQSARLIRDMLTLAATEPAIALAAEELDRDPFALACGNGTLDLRTGQLRPHTPADLISLGTDVPYEPEAGCPRWQRFLREVFQADDDLIGFIKRAAGYSLTGDTREHALFVCHGSGCNGKTTFLEALKRILGDLATTAPFESFTRARGDRVRNDLARLHRARLVAAAESGEDRRLDEATVKTLTGGDRVAARFFYSEFFEYVPRFKLWLATNHRPRIDGDDDAIWRRIRLVPFEVSFLGHEDKTLDADLAAETPGILRWAVEGCLEWQQEGGLGLPSAVERATSEYRQDEDVLGAFLADKCQLAGEADLSAFREQYGAYCGELGEKPLKPNPLGKRLRKRGIESVASRGRRVYRGVSLR